jgi:hypothetical protein
MVPVPFSRSDVFPAAADFLRLSAFPVSEGTKRQTFVPQNLEKNPQNRNFRLVIFHF